MSWSGRYLGRVLGRSPGRSLLSLLLAALLAFAFGVLTVLRGVYGDLYQNTEIKPVLSRIGYERAMKVAASGYVRDPYLEARSVDSQIELEDANIYFVNRFDNLLRDPDITWAEGWDEETFLSSPRQVMLMNARHAQALGVELGDKVRVNERLWLANLARAEVSPLPNETTLEFRDRLRPFATVVGLLHTETADTIAYMPIAAGKQYSCLFPVFYMDIAEYVLLDYHSTGEFREFIKGVMDGSQDARFNMDTSNADRIYRIHRLIETLYPLTIAAALLLGGVLPGLTVLHASREISVLRALGAKIGKCTGIYTLAQVLCALAGLALGFVLVLCLQKPDPAAVLRPFGLYLAAHLAACALGSGVFAWLSARKHVLAQLQAKE